MKLTSKQLLKDAVNLKQRIMTLSFSKMEVIILYNKCDNIIRQLNCRIHHNNQIIKKLPKGFEIKKTI